MKISDDIGCEFFPLLFRRGNEQFSKLFIDGCRCFYTRSIVSNFLTDEETHHVKQSVAVADLTTGKQQSTEIY